MTPRLQIELTGPQTVDGKRAPFQSLWFLVRLYYARRFEASAGMVRLAELRQQFTDARSLRMFISRAFKDFARWGVQAGWGEDIASDPRFLNQDRRSQGPFWLPHGAEDGMTCTVGGKPATQAELLGFLGLRSKPAEPASSIQLPLRADYWLAFATAQQDLRQGRLLSALGEGQANGALAGFKRASNLAGNPLQHALASLGESQVWRRLDDMDAARKALRQLRRAIREGRADEGGYLDAMEQILTAWCAYNERDWPLTEALLGAMRRMEPRATIVRCHPRIRFEWHNLMALLKRDRALEAGEFPLRQEAMGEAMNHFAIALDAAFELGSFDAAQQVMANIGMATWLFACEGIGGGASLPDMRAEALRWLLSSEWLCHCAGLVGQSAWNAIFLMRIARGEHTHAARPTLAEFRAAGIISPAEVASQSTPSGPFGALPTLTASWRSLAEQLLARQKRGEIRYGLLQRCSLWFEHAWYAAHEGDMSAASHSLKQLDAEMPGLPARDKAFFGKARDGLPLELLSRDG
jgi:hypothetical protein